MRCIFRIDQRSHSSPLMLDVELERSSRDKDGDFAYGEAFARCLRKFIETAGKHVEDNGCSMKSTASSNARRIVFDYKPGRVAKYLRKPPEGVEGRWEMRIPDDIADLKGRTNMQNLVRNLTMAFLKVPHVVPGESVERFARNMGFASVKEAVDDAMSQIVGQIESISTKTPPTQPQEATP